MNNNQKLLKELVKSAKKLEAIIQKFEEDVPKVNGYEVTYSDEIYEYNIIRNIERDIFNMYQYVEALNGTVVAEGMLVKNEYGRYEVEDYELFSGSSVEIWVEDESEFEWEFGYYTVTKILHSEGEYYAAALGRDTRLDGLRARIKRLP